MMQKGNKKINIAIFVTVIASCLLAFSLIILAMSKKINNVSHSPATVIVQSLPTTASTENADPNSVKATRPIANTEPASTENPLLVDINTASKDELMLLNGIGSVLADEIIAYRSNNNGFRNIEEIMNVSGIGSNLFDKLRYYIFVENPIYEITSATITEIQTDAPATEHVKTLDECAPININTASKEELMLLPHINEENALRIIDIRERINGYSHIYEILLIETITQNQAADIVQYICVK